MSSFEVCLKGGGPWGFRLHGGKEFGTPLRISKVSSYKVFRRFASYVYSSPSFKSIPHSARPIL